MKMYAREASPNSDLLTDVIMDGVIGYVSFFNYSKIEYIVGRDLTAFQVLTDILGRRSTNEQLEQELLYLQNGDTRIHLYDNREKAILLNVITNEGEAMKEQVRITTANNEVRLHKLRTIGKIERDVDLLKEMVTNNKVWKLQFKETDPDRWSTWDETGCYIQIK